MWLKKELYNVQPTTSDSAAHSEVKASPAESAPRCQQPTNSAAHS